LRDRAVSPWPDQASLFDQRSGGTPVAVISKPGIPPAPIDIPRSIFPRKHGLPLLPRIRSRFKNYTLRPTSRSPAVPPSPPPTHKFSPPPRARSSLFAPPWRSARDGNRSQPGLWSTSAEGSRTRRYPTRIKLTSSHRPLCPIVFECPLQPRLPVIEIHVFRNHRRHKPQNNCPACLSQLADHPDRRPMTSSLDTAPSFARHRVEVLKFNSTEALPAAIHARNRPELLSNAAMLLVSRQLCRCQREEAAFGSSHPSIPDPDPRHNRVSEGCRTGSDGKSDSQAVTATKLRGSTRSCAGPEN